MVSFKKIIDQCDNEEAGGRCLQKQPAARTEQSVNKIRHHFTIVGDIGGTKTALAVAEGAQLSQRQDYPSQAYSSLDALLADYLATLSVPTAELQAVLALAGPVVEQRSQATNLPWMIDAQALTQALGLAQVVLLNDLESLAWGIAGLTAEQFVTLHPGDETAQGNAAIIAPGTGLGIAGLLWDGTRHSPFATEGGHVDFAPADARDCALLEFLQTRYGRVSWERVVSGMGIVDLYQFLANQTEHAPAAVVTAADGDIAAAVAQQAAAGSCVLCVETMAWFARLLGRQAGNVALSYMARGGLYIGGGIVPKNRQLLTQAALLDGFFDKGRMRPLLEAMPVRLIVDPDVALLGAARFGQAASC